MTYQVGDYATCEHCDEPIVLDDNGAGGTAWCHHFGSTVCHDDPPGSHEDGDTTTTAEPKEDEDDGSLAKEDRRNAGHLVDVITDEFEGAWHISFAGEASEVFISCLEQIGVGYVVNLDGRDVKFYHTGGGDDGAIIFVRPWDEDTDTEGDEEELLLSEIDRIHVY